MVYPTEKIRDKTYYLVLGTSLDKYAVVGSDDNHPITQLLMRIYETGQVYYRSDIGAPILLKCNFSDILPNTVVNIVDNEGNTLEWHPSISLKDGSINRYGVEDKVYDFTINN